MRRRRTWLRWARTVVGLASACLLVGALAPDGARGQAASATFVNGQGEKVGTARLADDPAGVILVLDLAKLPPGTHGFHIHAIGQCKPPDFASAGPHFNPLVRKHGTRNPEGWHAGDLPNLMVGTEGTLKAELLVQGVTLGSPTSTLSLFPPTGTALVIHANADDEKTDPAGNAGARIACGVVTR